MKRHAQAYIEKLLTLFPCVALVGMRQCGKTPLLKALAAGWTLLDPEKIAERDHIERNPEPWLKSAAARKGGAPGLPSPSGGGATLRGQWTIRDNSPFFTRRNPWIRSCF